MARLLQLWSEQFGEVYINVDTIAMVGENPEGFGVIYLLNGQIIYTSSEGQEIVQELTRNGAMQCQTRHS